MCFATLEFASLPAAKSVLLLVNRYFLTEVTLMASNIALKQSTSQNQTGLGSSKDNQLEGDSGKAAGAKEDSGEPVINPEVLSTVTDEVLRARIRKLIEEKPKPTRFERLSNNNLIVAVTVAIISFALTYIVGGLLTNHYSNKQQELARQRSYSDELNKTRIQKFGDVWEQINENEVILDGLLNKANRTPGSNKEDFDKINQLIDEDIAVINKNRLWLGKVTYNQLREYVDKTGRYSLNMLLSQPGTSVNRQEREQAKQEIIEAWNLFLKGEPELDK